MTYQQRHEFTSLGALRGGAGAVCRALALSAVATVIWACGRSGEPAATPVPPLFHTGAPSRGVLVGDGSSSIADVSTGDIRSVTGNNSEAISLVYSPVAPRVFVVAGISGGYIADLEGASHAVVAREPVNVALWTTAGDKLAVQFADGVSVVDAADGHQIARFEHSRVLGWSPDGTELALGLPDSSGLQVTVWDPSTDTQVATGTEPLVMPSTFAWSADSTRVAWAARTASGQDILIMTVPTRSTSSIHTTGIVIDLAWSGGGGLFAAGVIDGAGDQRSTVHLYDGRSLQPIADVTGAQKFAAHPSEDEFAVLGDYCGDFNLYLASGTGIAPITASPAWDLNPLWSPDGSLLAFGTFEHGGEVSLATWDRDSSQLRTLATGPWTLGEVYPNSWSFDGSQLAFGLTASGPCENEPPQRTTFAPVSR